MKKLILFLLITSSLFSQTFFTLDNLKSLRIYMVASTDLITIEEKATIKENVIKRLAAAGFIFGEPDATNFMVKIQTVDIEDSHAIHIQIALAEDVITSRPDNIHTFAFTYFLDDFIESDNPYTDITESVDFLLTEFLDSYKDDNE
ncbi:MAG: hypothetical protein ACJAWW_001357 [Sulfurimonas sp.]|jgi:hypothetical protein